MSHLPYIIAAYGITLVVVAAFSIDAWTRMSRARRQLAAIDRRPAR